MVTTLSLSDKTPHLRGYLKGLESSYHDVSWHLQGTDFQGIQNLTRVDLGPSASAHAVPLGAPFGAVSAAAGDRVLGPVHPRPEGGVLGLQDFSLGCRKIFQRLEARRAMVNRQ